MSSIFFFFDVDFPLFDPKASTFRQIWPLLMSIPPFCSKSEHFPPWDPCGTPRKCPSAPQVPPAPRATRSPGVAQPGDRLISRSHLISSHLIFFTPHIFTPHLFTGTFPRVDSPSHPARVKHPSMGHALSSTAPCPRMTAVHHTEVPSTGRSPVWLRPGASPPGRSQRTRASAPPGDGQRGGFGVRGRASGKQAGTHGRKHPRLVCRDRIQ